ncbi:serine/threonine-protein kinase [Antrihabitans sp. YC2-6]|uniref:serine/threonine-protein kinase n=1 Tax=Antrihabitans sp. YC2-6 TaxID=2799498 RepID=UPI0018F3208B|nr:serine/threonine-protein kinase [Antrihabitans sp. YC2-6]MBJ8347814.1 serine/threonine protein kinase [Antrihabitans sp. YC2-6]
MSSADSLRPGSVFAGYRIERLLGSGGMGAVYLAMHPRLPKRVALKLLHPGMTTDRYVRMRFEQEAEHAARLEHPNIVAVEDRGRVGEQLWMAMRYVVGADAEHLLENGPVDPARAVYIVTETAEALDYAHELGVLHRDVKPANILLERRGSGRRERVLLADFGIAKALSESSDLTTSGTMVASLPYAAPEQFGDQDLDGRIDVYALGCTLFRLLTGRPPYPGNTLHQLWYGHVQAAIPQPSKIRPDLPAAFDAVVEIALAKKPEDRYRTCGELADAAIAALRPTLAAAATNVDLAHRTEPAQTPEPAVSPEPLETPEPPPSPGPTLRERARRLEPTIAAPAPAVENTEPREVRVRRARDAISSVRTRLEAVQTRAERLPPAYSALLREFSAASSEDLAGNDRSSRRQIGEADALLARAAAALAAGDADAALGLTRAVRAHLTAAERHVDAVTARLLLLREVRANPRARLDAARFRIRDAQMLAANLGIAQDWSALLDTQWARIDAIAAALRGPHPNYWAYVSGLDEVVTVVAHAVARMRNQPGDAAKRR